MKFRDKILNFIVRVKFYLRFADTLRGKFDKIHLLERANGRHALVRLCNG